MGNIGVRWAVVRCWRRRHGDGSAHDGRELEDRLLELKGRLGDSVGRRCSEPQKGELTGRGAQANSYCRCRSRGESSRVESGGMKLVMLWSGRGSWRSRGGRKRCAWPEEWPKSGAGSEIRRAREDSE